MKHFSATESDPDFRFLWAVKKKREVTDDIVAIGKKKNFCCLSHKSLARDLQSRLMETYISCKHLLKKNQKTLLEGKHEE